MCSNNGKDDDNNEKWLTKKTVYQSYNNNDDVWSDSDDHSTIDENIRNETFTTIEDLIAVPIHVSFAANPTPPNHHHHETTFLSQQSYTPGYVVDHGNTNSTSSDK